jgi:hypothetical protein
MAWEPDYITVAEAKSELGITNTDSDTSLASKITSASRSIDLFCKRQFGLLAAAEARYYTPWYDEDLRRWVVEIDDLMTTTDLVVKLDLSDDDTYGTALSASDYILRPRNAASKLRPWTQLAIKNTSSSPISRSDSVYVEGRWGWSAVPTTIKDATLLQVNRLLFRRSSPSGVAGSPESKSEIRLLAKLDPDVEVMCKAYQRLVRA